jgi:large subunit ribosomal protein L21
MYAVIEQGGKQYLCKEGQILKIEHISSINIGSTITFDKIISNGTNNVSVVKGEILSHKKTDKVIVFKKKRRHNYRRKQGHRQNITLVKILEIK